MVIGADIGANTQVIKLGANFGSILGGVLKGATAGRIGVVVGSILARDGFFSSAAAPLWMNFLGGAANGFVGEQKQLRRKTNL